MARLITVALGIVALAALAWLGWSGTQLSQAVPPDIKTPDEATAVKGEFAATPDAGTMRTEVPGAEQQSAAAPTATTGSLLLTVVWAKDASPALGVPVILRRSGVDSLFRAPRGMTEQDGEFLFEDLMPGTVYPAHEYGRGRIGKGVEIVAGRSQQVTLEIPAGRTVAGRVVDAAQAPVANASLVLKTHDLAGSRIVGTSAEDGTFVLREMPHLAGIGARKAGYEPSDLRSCDASVGAVVELTIVMRRGGGSIVGVVLDPLGQPVGGAAVRAGTTRQRGYQRPDGTSGFGSPTELVFSDERGRFAFACVATGDVPLAVRTQEFASWFRVVAVGIGAVREVSVNLLPGATLLGTVRFEDGSVVANTPVSVGQHERMANRRTRTGPDGTYRLEGLVAGEVQVRAGDLDLAVVEATKQLVVGEQLLWDPVLVRGAKLRGRVLQASGEPAQGFRVQSRAVPWERGDKWHGLVKTDDDGRFELDNIPLGRAIEIKVHGGRSFVEAVLHEVQVGPEELVIRLQNTSWGKVVGTVLGPDGEVLQEVKIGGGLPDVNAGRLRSTIDLSTGAFVTSSCPPGAYRIYITAPGFPRLRLTHELAAGETWDVGVVRLQHGSHVVVQLIGDPELLAGRVPLTVYQGGQPIARLETKDGSGRSTPLLAGDYDLFVGGGAIARHAVPFSIRLGAETTIDVPVKAGTETTIACTFAGTPPTRPAWAGAEVRDAKGVLVWRNEVYRHSEWQEAIRLAPGQYTVVMQHNELRGATQFDVGDTPGIATVRL